MRRALIAAAVAAAAMPACSTGGTGEVIFNELAIGDCRYNGEALENPESVSFNLNLFAAEAFGDGVLIRIQDGTTSAGQADGVYLSIGDVDEVTVGTDLPVGLPENVQSVLYLFNTCPAGRPAVALTGTVTFSAFEDADGDGGPDWGDRIAGTLVAAGFDDANPDAVNVADLVLTFDFVMRRGHPSRRFPTFDAIESY